MTNAVILAGTGSDSRRLIHGRNKAFLDIAEKPLISYVIQALKCSNAKEIGIVGPKAELEERIQDTRGCRIIEESRHPSKIRNFIENLVNSYKAMKNNDGIFYLTADIPLINQKVVNTELSRFRRTSADITLMLTEEKAIPQEFRKLRKFQNHSLRLDKDDYRWSNMFYVGNVDIDKLLLDMLDIAGRSFSFRRLDSLESKAKLAWFIFSRFPSESIRYTAGMLGKHEVEHALSERFRKRVEILHASSYESVVDIDYEEDLQLVDGYLRDKDLQKLIHLAYPESGHDSQNKEQDKNEGQDSGQ